MSRARSWERLISLRRNLERQEELKLAGANQRLQSAVSELRRQIAAQENSACCLEDHLRGSLSGGELQVAAWLGEVDRQRQIALGRQVESLTRQRDEQDASYRVRRRDREVLETAQQRRRAEEDLQAGRREQAQLDDAFLRQRRVVSS